VHQLTQQLTQQLAQQWDVHNLRWSLCCACRLTMAFAVQLIINTMPKAAYMRLGQAEALTLH
jgi:hypothetical protein